MKNKLLITLLILGVSIGLSIGCGKVEKIYDNYNYESITNEKGELSVISGGKIVAMYPNCKIIYSDSNTNALFIETNDGEEVYIQGDIIFELK